MVSNTYPGGKRPAMSPEEPPAKPAPDDKIDLNQSPIMKTRIKYWWIMISITAGVLTVILATSVQTSMKVSKLVERMPQLFKESENGFAADKKRYQALFKKGSKISDNWKLFGWNLYYVSKANEKKTWHDAKYFCKSRDSHLTSILNEEEQKYISSKLNESAWIGLTDENVEGHWEWSDGSRLIIQYWADGNPNGSSMMEKQMKTALP
ncbi:hepatic lectin-like isoform X3 [Pantherophis guttatus]|uniref:Hepatic lectin-like isoform X3 n=1 Tax=Pantherophis guttatus TaxID=94885 RepID=A0ABM3ZIE3_PANGU|nr:hepatic lectin-like isoform X3 [Pantherophis guttatus]